MKTFQIVLFLGFFIPIGSWAQSDTITQRMSLNEVVIQSGVPQLNVNLKNNKKDVQASTEKLMEQMTGVSLIKRGNFAQEPTIRGLNAAQINLTIDGMAIFGACTDRMDPISSYIEPNNLQSISASFSTDAASYGSSIGGGFNFKMKQPTLSAQNNWTGRVGIGYESNGNALQTLTSISYGKSKWAFNANGLFRNSGNYFAGGGKEILFSQYEKWNGSISAKYKINEGNYLSAQYVQDEGYHIGYPGLTMDVAYAKAKIGSLTYLFVNNTKMLEKWETKFYFNTIDHAMDDTKRPKELVPIHMDMPGTSQTFGFNSDLNFKLFTYNHLTIRLNGYQNRLHAEMTMYPDQGSSMFMLTIPDAQRSLLGIQLSDHQNISELWSLSWGGRLEQTYSSLYSTVGKQTLSGFYQGNLNRNHLVYNLFLNNEFKFKNGLSLLIDISRGMRSSSLKEMYGFYLFNRLDSYDYIGNPNLNNEKSWNFSAGADFKQERFGMGVRTFSYLFQNYIVGNKKNDFSAMTIGANGVKVFENLPSAALFGAEFEFHFLILQNLHFQSSNSFTYGLDNQKRALPLIPPFKSRNEIGYHFHSYLLQLEGILAAAQNHVSNSFYGEYKSPSFGVMNMRIGKSFKIKNSSLLVDFRIDNIFDTKYYEHLDLMAIPRMGRNFIIQTTFNF